MPQIKNAQEILDIILPIPAEKFITQYYGGEFLEDHALYGKSCFLGHIHRKLSGDPTNYMGDEDGYGARQLTRKFLTEVHGIGADGTSVNNEPFVNGYTEPLIKDRVVHMLNDMIKAGY